MRGVVSCAMAAGLHYLGLVRAFDAVYGSSAGALTGTFFVTGKMPLGPTIFYEDINNNNFISLWRLFSSRPVMSMDFLLDDVLMKRKPMNWKGVLESPLPLRIVVSSIKERRARVVGDFTSRDELFSALRASATIPVIGGPPIPFRDDLLYDASVYESVPVRSAIDEGCTHVLALVSRPRGILRGQPSFMERRVVAPRLKRISPGLADDFLERASDYKATMESLMSRTDAPGAPPYAYAVFPTSTREVGRLEKRRSELVAGAVSGLRAVFDTLASTPLARVHEVLYPVTEVGTIPKL
jgi:predicted patatin/cPLA2 family phospholipase